MPYECTLCNKSFTFQQSYHKHMLYHSAEKPHTCSECGRAFKELSTLHNHQRIHSGERPFGCETCGGYLIFFLSRSEHSLNCFHMNLNFNKFSIKKILQLSVEEYMFC